MVSQIGLNIKMLSNVKDIQKENNLRNVLINLPNFSSSIEIICNLYFKLKRIPIVSIRLKNILFFIVWFKSVIRRENNKTIFKKMFSLEIETYVFSV
jgi:hypothetical protein